MEINNGSIRKINKELLVAEIGTLYCYYFSFCVYKIVSLAYGITKWSFDDSLFKEVIPNDFKSKCNEIKFDTSCINIKEFDCYNLSNSGTNSVINFFRESLKYVNNEIKNIDIFRIFYNDISNMILDCFGVNMTQKSIYCENVISYLEECLMEIMNTKDLNSIAFIKYKRTTESTKKEPLFDFNGEETIKNGYGARDFINLYNLYLNEKNRLNKLLGNITCEVGSNISRIMKPVLESNFDDAKCHGESYIVVSSLYMVSLIHYIKYYVLRNKISKICSVKNDNQCLDCKSISGMTFVSKKEFLDLIK